MRAWSAFGVLIVAVVAGGCSSSPSSTPDPERAPSIPPDYRARVTYSPTGVWWDYARYPSMIRSTDGVAFEQGIPKLPVGDDRPKLVYNPVFIAQWALQQWDYYERGKGSVHLASAERAADWFISVQRADGGIPYRFRHPVGGMGPDVVLEPGWVSAMAQGELLSLLGRLYEETGDRRYLEAGNLALKPFTVSVADGGVRQELPDGTEGWYEEYPSSPPNYTLNGFQFALIGLYDWAEVAKSRRARRLYRAGIRALTRALPLFDLDQRSAYHLGHLTDEQPVFWIHWYGMVNARNLLWLSALERRNPVIARYRDRWQRYPDCQTPKGQTLCFTIN